MSRKITTIQALEKCAIKEWRAAIGNVKKDGEASESEQKWIYTHASIHAEIVRRRDNTQRIFIYYMERKKLDG